ncbi:hypothetical protein E1N52_30405 [Paraburkholderia guartelaensis]|uniref:Uncharacterized protein n=1 Tax=Paraburkholderia guartelaensis TaxID=2546446 RepID=A0A4R5L6E1_9BURK|nr:hypothetical protein E1N52_30405 [Paraburkholderia guartelaensis]
MLPPRRDLRPMSCAARYSETTSLKFILNPFEIFRTVKSRRMCPQKLSIIERLEAATQRLTMIFPTGANFRPGSRSLSNAVPTCWPISSGQALAAIKPFTSSSTGFRLVVRPVRRYGIHSASSSNASVQRRCTPSRYELFALPHSALALRTATRML